MPIKVFRSDQLGAPTLNGVAGTMIALLDAVLVNGYGSVSVTSITRTSNTATVTTATAHGFATYDIALIAGAVEAAYNGEVEVTVTSPTVFTYAVAGAPATPATGTITSKRAPAGFTKSFAATNKGVYRTNDTSGLRHYYRFVDEGLTTGGPREATLRGYVAMTDIDTGTDPYPNPNGSYGNGYYIQKSNLSDNTGRNWTLITNGRTVYFFANYAWSTATYASTGSVPFGASHGSMAFGDIISFKSGDSYAAFCTGAPGANYVSSDPNSGLFYTVSTITHLAAASTSPTLAMARDFTAVPGARTASLIGTGVSGSSTNLGLTASITYPHQVDNGFYMAPVLVTQGSPSVIRGRLPGAYESLHSITFGNLGVIDNVQGFSGRRFVMMYGGSSSSGGAIMLDVTGPWDS